VNQSGEFAAPVLTLAKDEAGAIRLAWDAIMGAVKYMVVLTDSNGAPVAEIDNGAETTCNLSAQEVFAKPEYVGLFSVSIRALSDDPEVFSNSEAQSANSHFASGAGTQGDPFIIDRDSYLRNISTANAKAAGCYYKLTYTPAPGADFEPICSPADPFAGIFDGNGKTIEGWEIRPLADKRNYFGFFGAVAEGAEVASLNFSRCSLYITNDGGSVNKADNGFAWVAGTNNGTLRDIAVTDCTIACETGTTPLNVGGIAANNNGTVLRCTASGAISAAADRNKTDEFTCGGIAAYNYATGVVDQCVNHASITAMNQVGGVVGMNGGKVTGSGNTGAITANYYFGGVVGYTTSSSAACVIEKCYNTGTLTMDEPAGMGRGAAYMGGVTSRIYSNKTVISKCYNTGDLIVGASVSSSSLRIGGIVGHTNKPPHRLLQRRQRHDQGQGQLRRHRRRDGRSGRRHNQLLYRRQNHGGRRFRKPLQRIRQGERQSRHNRLLCAGQRGRLRRRLDVGHHGRRSAERSADEESGVVFRLGLRDGMAGGRRLLSLPHAPLKRTTDFRMPGRFFRPRRFELRDKNFTFVLCRNATSYYCSCSSARSPGRAAPTTC